MFFWKFFGDFVDFCRLFLLDFVLDSFFFSVDESVFLIVLIQTVQSFSFRLHTNCFESN